MPAKALRCALAALLLAALCGCTARYFHDAAAAAVPVRHQLAHWPYREYWTGVVFNGEKVGFNHFALEVAESGRYALRSEAAIVLHFLGMEKKVTLKAHDVVNDDLTLASFDYDYVMDGSELHLAGAFAGGELKVEIRSGAQQSEQSFALSEPLYPSSALALYPALHGLEIGRQYRYLIYDGETQSLAPVEQRVEAFETSDLFSGSAYRVATELHNLKSTGWFDAQARPVFELGLNGVLISALEDEQSAKRYLAGASLNKRDVLLEFSLIRAGPVAQPRAAKRLEVRLSGLPEAPPQSATQHCRKENEETWCELVRPDPGATAAAGEAADPRYLAATLTVPSHAPAIRNTALQIVGARAEPLARIEALLAWLQANVKKQASDVFSALDVLEQRAAECQGHSYLYAAFARSLGIPTKVVNGLVYSEEFQGFLYHTWAESYVNGRWLALDPTFGQIAADATHLKLIEGESAADLMPLVDLIGKIRLRVLAQY